MEPIGGQCSQLCKSNSFSTSGQKCERDLAFGIEDVRPWGAQQKFSAAFADVSILASGGLTGIMCSLLGMDQSCRYMNSIASRLKWACIPGSSIWTLLHLLLPVYFA